jgi:hypothetical protein
MKADEPHVFEPIPEVPVTMPITGEALLSVQPLTGVQGRLRSPLCRICRKPENDQLHVQVKDEPSPEHWG